MPSQRNRSNPSRLRLSRFAPVLALVALLAFAGCGSSDGSSESSSAGSAAAAGGGPPGFELSAEQQSCLKEQGVEAPAAPQGGEGGPPAGFEGGAPPEGGGSDFQQAMEKCGVEIPEGGPGGEGGPPGSPGFKKQIKEYAACVRENGYDLPEPNLSGKGPVFDSSEVDREDPKFEAANEKCQSRLTP